MAVDHYENFPVASLALPARLRRPVKAIYRFARSADDIADEGDATEAERLRGLDRHREQLNRIVVNGTVTDTAFTELAEVIAAHKLPMEPFYDLLDAFEQDVTTRRYASYDALADYCRRSANPIGTLMLHLYGAATRENLRDSDRICSALQLINFWQDVAIDYAKGRIYIPQEDLARFGITELQIARGDASGAWPALMRFEVERAGTLLAAGAGLARRLRGRIGLELAMIVAGGQRIVTRLGRIDGDVFRRRPVLNKRDWLLMAGRALASRIGPRR